MNLQKGDLIKPVESSDWAIPVVPVLKSCGLVLICVDCTVKSKAKMDASSPRIKDIFWFIDRWSVVLQIGLGSFLPAATLDEETKWLVVVDNQNSFDVFYLTLKRVQMDTYGGRHSLSLSC